MATTKAQQKAVNKYVKANYDRIEFKAPKGRKAEIKAHAEARGESVNSFIGRAVDETIERDTRMPAEATGQLPAAAALLSPDILAEAQNAAERTGEAVPEFVTRAVKAQAKRDETTRRMGLNPVTGSKLGQDSETE